MTRQSSGGVEKTEDLLATQVGIDYTAIFSFDDNVVEVEVTVNISLLL